MSARGTSRAALEREIERLRGELSTNKQALDAERDMRSSSELAAIVALEEGRDLRGMLQKLREDVLAFQTAESRLTLSLEESWDVLYDGAGEAEVNGA